MNDNPWVENLKRLRDKEEKMNKFKDSVNCCLTNCNSCEYQDICPEIED